MATRKPKTWSELLADIDATMKKWDAVRYITVDIENDLTPRARQKRWQTAQEREVRLRFTIYTDERRDVRADVRSAETATDNLRLIATALEMMRLAEVRGVHKVMSLLYRQMYRLRPSAPLHHHHRSRRTTRCCTSVQTRRCRLRRRRIAHWRSRHTLTPADRLIRCGG